MIQALIAAFVVSIASSDVRAVPAQAGPLPRSQAYFGLHLDIHAQRADKAIGADVSEDNIEKLLDAVKPDYVQHDSKGHPGLAIFPSEFGNSAPGIVKDSLQVWSQVTRKHNIGLNLHYSGLRDFAAVRANPAWARVQPNGQEDQQAASTFGPYVDRLLIPQLEEAIARYSIAGVGMDGDAWAAELDYSPAAVAAWKSKSGQEPPRRRNEPLWNEWKAFHRAQYERYASQWVDALHKKFPGVQLGSNWLYSARWPTPPNVKVDFLSGDVSPNEAADTARIHARYFSQVGKPWALVSWGSRLDENRQRDFKTVPMLIQEAALILSQGGAYSLYYVPTRQGFVGDDIIGPASEVAAYVRSIQPLVQGSSSVPQVALWFPTQTVLDRANEPFAQPNALTDIQATLEMLLESHYSVDVVPDFRLVSKLADYKVVVVPEIEALSLQDRSALSNFARDGGSLVLLGADLPRQFEAELGVNFPAQAMKLKEQVQTASGTADLDGVWQPVQPRAAKVLLERSPMGNVRRESKPAATMAGFGRGQVAAIYGPVGTAFAETQSAAARAMLAEVVRAVFPSPIVDFAGPNTIDVVARRTRDGKLAIHFINLSRKQVGGSFLWDGAIQPTAPLAVKLRVPSSPSSVTWEPSGTKLASNYNGGVLSVQVPGFNVHGILVVQ